MYTSHERSQRSASSYDRTGAQQAAENDQKGGAGGGRSHEEPYRPSMSLHRRSNPPTGSTSTGLGLGGLMTGRGDFPASRSSILNLVDHDVSPPAPSTSSTNPHYQARAPQAAEQKRVLIPNPTAPFLGPHTSLLPSHSHDRDRDRPTLPPIRSPDPDRRFSHGTYDRPSSAQSSPYLPTPLSGGSGSGSIGGSTSRGWTATVSTTTASRSDEPLLKEYFEGERRLRELQAERDARRLAEPVLNTNSNPVQLGQPDRPLWNVLSVRGPDSSPPDISDARDARPADGAPAWTPRDSLRKFRASGPPAAPVHVDEGGGVNYKVHGGKPMTFPVGFVGDLPPGWDPVFQYGTHLAGNPTPAPPTGPSAGAGPSQASPTADQRDASAPPPPPPTSMPMQPHGRNPLPSARHLYEAHSSSSSRRDEHDAATDSRASKRVRHASPEATFARPSTSASTSAVRTPQLSKASPASSSRDTFPSATSKNRHNSPPRVPASTARTRDTELDGHLSESGGSPSAVNGEDEFEAGVKVDAAERRRRNTEAARRSRARKRDRATYLEDQKQMLEAKTTNLRLERDYWKRQARAIAVRCGVEVPGSPKEADLRRELGLAQQGAPLGDVED